MSAAASWRLAQREASAASRVSSSDDNAASDQGGASSSSQPRHAEQRAAPLAAPKTNARRLGRTANTTQQQARRGGEEGGVEQQQQQQQQQQQHDRDTNNWNRDAPRSSSAAAPPPQQLRSSRDAEDEFYFEREIADQRSNEDRVAAQQVSDHPSPERVQGGSPTWRDATTSESDRDEDRRWSHDPPHQRRDDGGGGHRNYSSKDESRLLPATTTAAGKSAGDQHSDQHHHNNVDQLGELTPPDARGEERKGRHYPGRDAPERERGGGPSVERDRREDGGDKAAAAPQQQQQQQGRMYGAPRIPRNAFDSKPGEKDRALEHVAKEISEEVETVGTEVETPTKTTSTPTPISSSNFFEGLRKGRDLEQERQRVCGERAAGLRPALFDPLTIPLVLRDLHSFLQNPVGCATGVQVRCFIERSGSGLFNISPVYTLYADHEDGSGRLLLCARKKIKSKFSHYVIATNMDDLYRKRGERSRHFLAKLRATDTSSTEYTLYDNGKSPRELGLATDKDEEEDSDEDAPTTAAKSPDDEEARKSVRKELAVVFYNHDKSQQSSAGGKGAKKNRKMEIAIPAVVVVAGSNTTRPELWQSVASKETLAANFARARYTQAQNASLRGVAQRMFVMHWRESKYDPLSSCLVDFKERANCGSVKNFQAIKSYPEDKEKASLYYSTVGGTGWCENEDPDAPAPVLLQMGKVGKNCFNMDFQYPMSVLQAFGICLSRFDTSLNW